PRAQDLGVDRILLVTARPAVEALAVRIKADEVLLAHFVEPDSGALHPDHLRPGEPSAHVPVDVVGLAFAGKDATREAEIPRERVEAGPALREVVRSGEGDDRAKALLLRRSARPVDAAHADPDEADPLGIKPELARSQMIQQRRDDARPVRANREARSVLPLA